MSEMKMKHELTLKPCPIADSWGAECSCGKWRSAASFYKYPNGDDLLNRLRMEFKEHAGHE